MLASLFPGRVQELFDGSLIVTSLMDTQTVVVHLSREGNVLRATHTSYAHGSKTSERDATSQEIAAAVTVAVNTLQHTFRAIEPYRRLNGIMPVIEKSPVRRRLPMQYRMHAVAA